MTDQLMPGDYFRVKEDWRNLRPDTPLIGVRLRVAIPDALCEAHEVSTAYEGERWYVLREYCEREG